MRMQYAVRASSPELFDDPPEQSPLGGPWKRAFDVAVASIGLITLTPMLLAIAGLIRLFLGRPILVAEERIGYKGRTFNCYAFRTSGRNATGRPYFQGVFWGDALKQVMRGSGLEELPRLLNVVRGDMSLIGPRPIAESDFPRYRVRVPEYFFARPGVTGLWRHVDWRRSPLAVDRYYFRYWSMRLDLALLIRAIFHNSSKSAVGFESKRVTRAHLDLT